MSTLVKCKACGKSVSESASRCPSCGEPTKSRRVLIAILLIGAGLWFGRDIWIALFAPMIEPLVQNLP